jgi:hypothetical protein
VARGTGIYLIGLHYLAARNCKLTLCVLFQLNLRSGCYVSRSICVHELFVEMPGWDETYDRTCSLHVVAKL